ncbi:uncharacterized protein [Nicotiana tomentosiformis]|uniref:uncharacterized protein n=1 Tax=Nicotiana tomentosiformis TaxID=4098 RepID=UPI00388C4779
MAAVQRDLNLCQHQWMEPLKDYDSSILYHPGKANVVGDALSRISIESLAHIVHARRLLVEDMHRLDGTGIRFSVRYSEALLACVQAKSSLVERIKATEYEDERLCKYRDETLASKSKDMIVESDGVLGMGKKLCVADVEGLRQAILEEAHKSRYIIHPRSTKMYHDLKQFHWWGALGTRVDLSTAFHPQTDGLSERTIQILEDMLRACILEFGSSWDAYLSLAEFAYNNSFQSSIPMEPYEALYGRRCRSPSGWFEAVFHVSMLRKCISDSSHVLEAPTIPPDEKLSYEEEPMAIADRQMARTRTPSSVVCGVEHGTNRVGGQVGVHQTRIQAAPQPEVGNMGQPQATMPDQVQEQGVQDAPSPVPTVVPTVALPVDAVDDF